MRIVTLILLAQAGVITPQGLSPVPVDGKSELAKPVQITDAQRLRIRELQRDYWQAQAQFFAAKATSDALLKEIQTAFQALAATCKPPQQFEQESLTCRDSPRQPNPASQPRGPSAAVKQP